MTKRHNERHTVPTSAVLDSDPSGSLTRHQTTEPDKLDRLIAEYQRAHNPRREAEAASGSLPRRLRVTALFIPEHLCPTVCGYMKSGRIRCVAGVFEEGPRRQTIYVNAAGAANILEAFNGQGVHSS